jgi:hypothetical protein
MDYGYAEFRETLVDRDNRLDLVMLYYASLVCGKVMTANELGVTE